MLTNADAAAALKRTAKRILEPDAEIPDGAESLHVVINLKTGQTALALHGTDLDRTVIPIKEGAR